MKEPFDDEKLYFPDEAEIGCLRITNFREVLEKYSYGRYVQRFRLMAQGHHLKVHQRPKLDENQYRALMKTLADTLVTVGEKGFLNDAKTVKVAERLLIMGLFDEYF